MGTDLSAILESPIEQPMATVSFSPSYIDGPRIERLL